LNPNGQALEVRENFQKGVHIPGLTEVLVKTHEEAMDLL